MAAKKKKIPSTHELLRLHFKNKDNLALWDKKYSKRTLREMGNPSLELRLADESVELSKQLIDVSMLHLQTKVKTVPKHGTPFKGLWELAERLGTSRENLSRLKNNVPLFTENIFRDKEKGGYRVPAKKLEQMVAYVQTHRKRALT